MKMRVTITFEYDVEVGEKATAAYGTDDPIKMAAVDQEGFQNEPDFVAELMYEADSLKITVTPVDALISPVDIGDFASLDLYGTKHE